LCAVLEFDLRLRGWRYCRERGLALRCHVSLYRNSDG
jgi:hypothetical protein